MMHYMINNALCYCVNPIIATMLSEKLIYVRSRLDLITDCRMRPSPTTKTSNWNHILAVFKNISWNSNKTSLVVDEYSGMKQAVQLMNKNLK